MALVVLAFSALLLLSASSSQGSAAAAAIFAPAVTYQVSVAWAAFLYFPAAADSFDSVYKILKDNLSSPRKLTCSLTLRIFKYFDSKGSGNNEDDDKG